MVVVETQRQLVGIEVTQSLHAVITTIGVDTIVVKREVIIESVINLGCGLSTLSMGRSLNRSSRLPTTNTGVVETPHMVFTNPIMTTHVHKTTN